VVIIKRTIKLWRITKCIFVFKEFIEESSKFVLDRGNRMSLDVLILMLEKTSHRLLAVP